MYWLLVCWHCFAGRYLEVVLHEEVLKESMDHRLGQGIWRAGGVWKDTEDNEAKDVKEIEVRVSGRKKSK